MRDWVTNVDDTFYIIGTVAGPHPYPAMVRDFQSVIGREARAQMLERTGRLPDALVACVGGGSNAIGLFYPFIDDREVAMYGVEAAGDGLSTGRHAAPLCAGRPGVLHGNRTYLMEDERRPDHRDPFDLGRSRLSGRRAGARLAQGHRAAPTTSRSPTTRPWRAFHALTRIEGIIPALESSHALAYAAKLAPTMRKDQIIVINLSGRGDKDMHTVAARDGMKL